MTRFLKGISTCGRTLALAGLVLVAGACGGGGGASTENAEMLHDMKVYCPGALSECDPANAGADVYVGYKIGGTPGTCPSLLAQGQPAFDAFGTVPASDPWNSGITGVVSSFTNGSGQPVTSLSVAPSDAILCCVVIDTQGNLGPDSGDPYDESDCYPFHDTLNENNIAVDTLMP